MAKKNSIGTPSLFVGGTILFSLAWMMPSFPLLAFVGFAPFIAIAANNRKEKSMWSSLELVLLGLSISFFCWESFFIRSIGLHFSTYHSVYTFLFRLHLRQKKPWSRSQYHYTFHFLVNDWIYPAKMVSPSSYFSSRFILFKTRMDSLESCNWLFRSLILGTYNQHLPLSGSAYWKEGKLDIRCVIPFHCDWPPHLFLYHCWWSDHKGSDDSTLFIFFQWNQWL